MVDNETSKISNKKAQVWVETAIYTLIGLTIISIILSIGLPQIEKIQDKGILEQSIRLLEDIDRKIYECAETPGNVRIITFRLAKGKIEVDPNINTITYKLENTRLKLSEPGLEIKEGELILKTEKNMNKYNINVIKKYDTLNLKFSQSENLVTITPSSLPYKLQIENQGDNEVLANTTINLERLS